MTKLWLLLLLFFPHTVSAEKITEWENEMLKKKCFAKPSVLYSRVKRRQPANSYKYPFAAALCLRLNVPGEEIEEHSIPTCSGVLISPRHILTAASCLYTDYIRSCTQGLRPPRLSEQHIGIFLSSRCTNSECWFNEKMLKPTSVVMHPSYKDCMRDTSFDLGVIELDEDVNITPVCMPEVNSTISREKLEFLGYGGEDGQEALQSVWYEYVMEEGKTIFAYNMTMKNDHAPGDSGGPLLQKNGGRHYVLGIHGGYGYKVHNSGGRAIPIAIGGMYVDVRSHVPWICGVTVKARDWLDSMEKMIGDYHFTCNVNEMPLLTPSMVVILTITTLPIAEVGDPFLLWKQQMDKWQNEYITDWQYHFEQYKKYQTYRHLDDSCNAI